MKKILFFTCLLMLLACHKHKLGSPFRNGTYIGQYSFKNYPQYNFTDTFTLFSYHKRIGMYCNNAINPVTSTLNMHGSTTLNIKNYDFIPDSFPHKFSAYESKVEKKHIAIKFEGFYGVKEEKAQYQGNIELNYLEK